MDPPSPLLILCCFGGQPFVDLHLNTHSMHTIDPTDWMATDTAGFLLSNSSSSIPGLDTVVRGGTPIENCDLFNITFTTHADEHMYEKYRGNLGCRCPPRFSGKFCEIPPPVALPLVSVESASSSLHTLSPDMLLVVGAILLALFFLTFMMTRGCFCDCFGPFKWPWAKSELDEPLDPEVVKRLLDQARAHEARRQMDIHHELHGPMVSTISEGTAAPYNTTIMPSAPPPARQEYSRPPPIPRAPSPPPSYRSVAGSIERINSQV